MVKEMSIHYCIEQSRLLEHGNMEVHIGEYYYNHHEWGLASQWLNRALKKGKLEEPSRARCLLEKINLALK